jgi:general nucleoside transport system permease protein
VTEPTGAAATVIEGTQAPMRTTLDRLLEALLPPFVALLVSIVAGDLLILAVGQSPGAVYRLMLEGTWGNAYGFGQVLYKTTTLICTGLAVAVGLRAGLFNIGAEGQLAAGGLGAALVGLALPSGTSAVIAVPLCTIAAMCAGGAVGFVPGALRAKWGAHEVITTIMLNFIVLALLSWMLSTRLRVPETLHTETVHAGVLPRLSAWWSGFHGSAANGSIVIVLFAALLVDVYLFRTRGGFELRAVGLQPDASENAGIDVGRTWIRALTISGALAGLGGINFVLGYEHYYEEGFATGAGFLGIAVALVGRSNPFGVVLAALFFATLSQGGLAINALVPKQMVDALQGVVILAMAASVPEVQRLLAITRKGVG